jgi:hypothetical protein
MIFYLFVTWQYEFSKTTDRLARRSKFGVIMCFFPYMLSSGRRSSNIISSKFVCFTGFDIASCSGSSSATMAHVRKAVCVISIARPTVQL